MAPSIIWEFFEVLKNDKTNCKCNLCGVRISRGGKSAKTFTTTNMMNHLKKVHPIAMAKENDKSKKKSTEAGSSKIMSNFSTESTAGKQMKLDELIEKGSYGISMIVDPKISVT